MSNATVPPVNPGAGRAHALDALRGFAILAMLLSGQLPFGDHALPAWMYHAQEPPPTHVWDNTHYGITWVDLVFPFFLFSMGASFPLAFSRRMERGTPGWKLALFIAERGVLLAFFALYVMAIRPTVISHEPTSRTWWLGLLGFALLFPVLTRLPDSWSPRIRAAIKISGWAGVILMLSLLEYPGEHTGFWLGRSDIIIVVLANMAVFGSIVWMLTRDNVLARVGVMGIVLATRMSNMPHPLGGWVTDLWKLAPPWISWIYSFYYLQYLCIVIPGTIAGDLILKWSRRSAAESGSEGGAWSAGRLRVICGLMFLFVLVVLVGMEYRTTHPGAGMSERPLLLCSSLCVFCMCAFGAWLLRKPGGETERLYRSLFSWGAYWLILGLVLEPYEGGIRKDKATVSYYFVTSGLANFMFIGLSVIADRFKKKRWLQLLIDNGQNPMIAYAGINNFVLPVLALAAIAPWLNSWANTPWRGFCQGALVTLMVALTVSFLTRRKIFWRT